MSSMCWKHNCWFELQRKETVSAGVRGRVGYSTVKEYYKCCKGCTYVVIRFPDALRSSR